MTQPDYCNHGQSEVSAQQPQLGHLAAVAEQLTSEAGAPLGDLALPTGCEEGGEVSPRADCCKCQGLPVERLSWMLTSAALAPELPGLLRGIRLQQLRASPHRADGAKNQPKNMARSQGLLEVNLRASPPLASSPAA